MSDEPKTCPFCDNEPLNQSTGETWCSNPTCLLNSADIREQGWVYQIHWDIRPREAALEAELAAAKEELNRYHELFPISLYPAFWEGVGEARNRKAAQP